MSNTPNNPIRASDVEAALNSGGVAIYASSTSKMSFNDEYVRYLAGKTDPGATISMNDMRSKPGPQYTGTEISSVCNGTTLNQILADGKYGTYEETVLKSISCAPAYGTFKSQECSGSTLVQTYHDGKYGTYTVDTANSNVCETLYIASTTNLIFDYTIQNGEGGVGEDFFRNTGITSALPYRGQVWVNYLCYAYMAKNWDFQLQVGATVVARDVVANNGRMFGAVETDDYGTAVGPSRERPGPWLEWSGVVDVNVGDVIRGYTYLWGAYGSDRIIGGYLQVGAITN